MTTDHYHHGNLKNDLIEAGLRLINQGGVEQFSLRKAAAACGVSHAAPYKHFQNKEQLLAAIAEHVESKFERALSGNLEHSAGSSPQTRLVELGKTYVSFMVDHPDYFHFLFFSPGRGSLTLEILQNESDPCGSFALFRQVAMDYLKSVNEAPEEYPYDILALWSLVHGLAVMLVENRLCVGEQQLEALVTRSLNNSCRGFGAAARS